MLDDDPGIPGASLRLTSRNTGRVAAATHYAGTSNRHATAPRVQNSTPARPMRYFNLLAASIISPCSLPKPRGPENYCDLLRPGEYMHRVLYRPKRSSTMTGSHEPSGPRWASHRTASSTRRGAPDSLLLYGCLRRLVLPSELLR